jgi:hypothetical protein
MTPYHQIPRIGHNRPISQKFITKYNLSKLFEDSEHPLQLERVLPGGEPVLAEGPKI